MLLLNSELVKISLFNTIWKNFEIGPDLFGWIELCLFILIIYPLLQGLTGAILQLLYKVIVEGGLFGR